MKIRKATAEDQELFYNIYFNQRNTDRDMGVNYVSDDFPTLFQHSISLIADDCGILMAFDMGIWCYIDILCVKKDSRGKGVATSLLNELCRLAPKRWKAIETCYEDEDHEIKDFLRSKHFNDEMIVRWSVKVAK